jgi:hypothetical protein
MEGGVETGEWAAAAILGKSDSELGIRDAGVGARRLARA